MKGYPGYKVWSKKLLWHSTHWHYGTPDAWVKLRYAQKFVLKWFHLTRLPKSKTCSLYPHLSTVKITTAPHIEHLTLVHAMLFLARFVWIHKVPNGSSNDRLGSGFAAKTPSTPIKILGDQHARYAWHVLSRQCFEWRPVTWPCCKTVSITRGLPSLHAGMGTTKFQRKHPLITQWYWTIMNKQLYKAKGGNMRKLGRHFANSNAEATKILNVSKCIYVFPHPLSRSQHIMHMKMHTLQIFHSNLLIPWNIPSIDLPRNGFCGSVPL